MKWAEQFRNAIRNPEADKATELLVRYGQVSAVSRPNKALTEDLKNRVISSGGIKAICEKIADSRWDEETGGGTPLDPAAFHDAVRYGFKNFADIYITSRTAIQDQNLSNASFDGAKLNYLNFSNVNFAEASFKETRINDVYFSKSNLLTADLSHIAIRGEALNLTDREVKIGGEAWNVRASALETRHIVCSDCEEYNRSVLGIEEGSSRSKYHRRGIILFSEGIPIGYMKLKGERTFLAMRTVRNKKDEAIFWKGMVYSFSEHLEMEIRNHPNAKKIDRSSNSTDAWLKLDLETAMPSKQYFMRDNQRFINQPDMYDALTKLTDAIENGDEPLLDISNT